MRASIIASLVLASGCASEERGAATTTVATSVGSTMSGGGESTSSAESSEAGSSEAGTTTAMASDTSGEATTSAASSSGAAESSGDTSTGGIVGLESLGSLVVLGDSIGDGGGQSPFYYTLLRDELDAHYGGIEYVHAAESGSETGDLLGQVNGLPNALPGPVAVVITSGGNDMKSAIQAIVLGADGPARTAMQGHIEVALDALLAPNRFGAGVEVFVFEGNVYDASDGVGDFGMHDCAFGGGLPTIPSDDIFERWNDSIAEAVEGKGQRAVDMHAWFYGHGYASNPSWYASDCTHPSAVGHDELHALFFAQITGELP